MSSFNKNIGDYGEDLAVNFLRKMGYIILERNFRCKCGEIDVICKDESYIAFVEVKSRYGKSYGIPSEAITYRKQLKLYQLAEIYIMKKKLFNYNYRFDVVEIILSSDSSDASMKVIKDAFQL